tara:strand:- start:347 stop:565 length:219 start_codon:yes stop_codon:yes gene_type:complete
MKIWSAWFGSVLPAYLNWTHTTVQETYKRNGVILVTDSNVAVFVPRLHPAFKVRLHFQTPIENINDAVTVGQ